MCNPLGESCFHFIAYEAVKQKLLELESQLQQANEKLNKIEVNAFLKASDMIRYEYDGFMNAGDIEDYFYEHAKSLTDTPPKED